MLSLKYKALCIVINFLVHWFTPTCLSEDKKVDDKAQGFTSGR